MSDLAAMAGGRLIGDADKVESIRHLLTDSRKMMSPSTSLFFAMKGDRRDGHEFIPELYAAGVRSFVVSDESSVVAYPDACFLVVNDTLNALQQISSEHRSKFKYPVVAITGSNGKTIVKEWL
ncbi:MAG: Mur ligase domain-containing protein, partial [Bacteroidota bacterium]